MSNRVLVVDDEDDIVYMIGVILRSAGFEVDSAAGVQEAKENLRKREPDLMLLDLRLSDGDGWDLLAAMQSDERAKRIPVVILSAHIARDSDEAVARGARGLVAKPFSASSLLETVQSHLASV